MTIDPDATMVDQSRSATNMRNNGSAANGVGTSTAAFTSPVPSPFWDWMALFRASNAPTVLADCTVGLAMAAAVRATLSYPSHLIFDGLLEVVCAMCAMYFAGMVLNAILDRDIDAVERPMRPVASGRIRVASAWTAFIALLTVALSLGIGMTSGIVPLAVAALVGVWTLEKSRQSRSIMLQRIGRIWIAVTFIGVVVWLLVTLLSDPFDLSDFKPDRAEQIRFGWRAITISMLLLAGAAVGYNLVHRRTAWSVLLLALCRFLVPVCVCTALLGRSGALDPTLLSMNSLVVLAILLLPPLAIALHTLMLSIVARREADLHFTEARCSRCGYRLHDGTIVSCSECGSNLQAYPPICHRPISPALRVRMPFIAAVGLLPTLLLLAASIRQQFGVFRLTNIPNASSVWGGIGVALAGLAALFFVLSSVRGLGAALNHPSRRPAGIAALIAALAMLDACLCMLLGQLSLLIACIAFWFATRLLQRKIAGS